LLGGLKGGGYRVLACADTGARTPLGVRQYYEYKTVCIVIYDCVMATASPFTVPASPHLSFCVPLIPCS
jgi:hypothetical protein